MTRGSQSAQANALLQTLEAIRGAVDHYYAEHHRYPGYNPSDNSPNNQWFIDQLTLYSDLEGDVSRTPTSTHIYGPYLREPFPVNPINGKSLVRVRADGDVAVATGASGWIANLDDGQVIINADFDDLVRIGMDLKDVSVSIGKAAVVTGL